LKIGKKLAQTAPTNDQGPGQLLGHQLGLLHFLFGENPSKSGSGIKLIWDNGKWRITFPGNVTFRHDLINGKMAKAQLNERVAATR
jgi:hypothetical protein